MATKEEIEQQAKAEAKADIKAKDLKEKVGALTKLNKKLERTVEKAEEQPNTLQIGVTVIAGGITTVGAIGYRRWAKQKTKDSVDPKTGKPTMGAHFIRTGIPVLVGGGTALVSSFSDSGIVASTGIGAGAGLIVGTFAEMLFPTEPPKEDAPKP